MGVGQGYALAAALFCRDYSPSVSIGGSRTPPQLSFSLQTKVLVVQGDSAFGFSGMEIETIARLAYSRISCRYSSRGFRYKLPVITVVLNNNGISRGLAKSDQAELEGDLTQV